MFYFLRWVDQILENYFQTHFTQGYFSNLKVNTFEPDVFDIFLGMIDDKLANTCWSFSPFLSNWFILNDTRCLEMLVVESLAIVSNLLMPKWILILCLGYQNLKFIDIKVSLCCRNENFSLRLIEQLLFSWLFQPIVRP